MGKERISPSNAVTSEHLSLSLPEKILLTALFHQRYKNKHPSWNAYRGLKAAQVGSQKLLWLDTDNWICSNRQESNEKQPPSGTMFISRSKPSGNYSYMYHLPLPRIHSALCAHKVCLCALNHSQNRERLFPSTDLKAGLNGLFSVR